MDQPTDKVLDYARPMPTGPSRSKKPLVVLLGWVFIVGPALAGSVVGIVVTLSNLIAPGRSYRMGDSTVTPRSQGVAMEWFKLAMCLLLAVFLSAIVWRAAAIARKMRREL